MESFGEGVQALGWAAHGEVAGAVQSIGVLRLA